MGLHFFVDIIYCAAAFVSLLSFICLWSVTGIILIDVSLFFVIITFFRVIIGWNHNILYIAPKNLQVNSTICLILSVALFFLVEIATVGMVRTVSYYSNTYNGWRMYADSKVRKASWRNNEETKDHHSLIDFLAQLYERTTTNSN